MAIRSIENATHCLLEIQHQSDVFARLVHFGVDLVPFLDQGFPHYFAHQRHAAFLDVLENREVQHRQGKHLLEVFRTLHENRFEPLGFHEDAL